MNKILNKALVYLVGDATTEEQEQFARSVHQIHKATVKANLATYAEGDEVLMFVNMESNTFRDVRTNPIVGYVERVCFQEERVFVKPNQDDRRVNSHHTWGLQYFDLKHKGIQ